MDIEDEVENVFVTSNGNRNYSNSFIILLAALNYLKFNSFFPKRYSSFPHFVRRQQQLSSVLITFFHRVLRKKKKLPASSDQKFQKKSQAALQLIHYFFLTLVFFRFKILRMTLTTLVTFARQEL